MPLPETGTVIDLRPDDQRAARPLASLTNLPVVAVSLAAIEDGRHGLSTCTPPLVVVCERGVRSGLAARYLLADGLNAAAYPGGEPALRREVTP